MNKRDLKAYSRFDGTGRIVPGSTVLRRQKPKVGNWKEVQAYECCNVAPIFVGRETEFPFYVSIMIIPNDGDYYQTITASSPSIANDENELLVILNTLKSLGTFKTIEGSIFLTPTIQIDEFYKANNTSFYYATVFGSI
jgi:hypothetical protein